MHEFFAKVASNPICFVLLMILAGLMALFLCFLLILCVFAFAERLRHPHGYESSLKKIRDELQKIVDRTPPYGFDDIAAKRLKDPQLEAVRQRVLKPEWNFPPESKKEVLNPQGYEALRAIVREHEQEINSPSVG